MELTLGTLLQFADLQTFSGSKFTARVHGHDAENAGKQGYFTKYVKQWQWYCDANAYTTVAFIQQHLS